MTGLDARPQARIALWQGRSPEMWIEVPARDRLILYN
jgi:hypothetical protein